jgi:hypothetical protein
MSKSRHKIAHILPWPFIGGTEHGPLRIALATGSEEFQHMAFHLEGAYTVREMYAAAGIETAAYNTVEPSYRRPKEFLRASFQLAREFRRRKVDLIHCADMLAAHRVGVAGKLARVPVVSHIRCLFDDISKRDQSFCAQWINSFSFQITHGSISVIRFQRIVAESSMTEWMPPTLIVRRTIRLPQNASRCAMSSGFPTKRRS